MIKHKTLLTIFSALILVACNKQNVPLPDYFKKPYSAFDSSSTLYPIKSNGNYYCPDVPRKLYPEDETTLSANLLIANAFYMGKLREHDMNKDCIVSMHDSVLRTKEYFTFYDTNKDDHFTNGEYEKLTISEDFDYPFKTLDKDQSGDVNFDEMLFGSMVLYAQYIRPNSTKGEITKAVDDRTITTWSVNAVDYIKAHSVIMLYVLDNQ